MRKPILLSSLLLLSLVSSASVDSLPWKKKMLPGYCLFYTRADSSLVSWLEKDLSQGISEVGGFFHQSFKKSFDVFVFPEREALDRQWEKDWNSPGFRSECWMVASGVANRLDLLSPLSWKKQACDHNPQDSLATQQIITHELVHVFHGQQNPRPGFDGMDDMSWLIEGLANYASGQLTSAKLKEVRDKLASGNGPVKLADLWKGNLRYQQAGSLILYIDKKYGKEKLLSLLIYTSNNDVLKALGTTEQELLSAWKNQ